MNNIDKPYKLRKRFRYNEESKFVHRKLGWQKRIIDLENGSYMGRTPMRWLYLVFFYLSFYGALILLFAFCFLVFDGTVEYQYPKWFVTQPGFSFEPSLSTGEYFKHIKFHLGEEHEISRYVNRLEKSLSKYGPVPKNYFGPCSSEQDFGYKEGKPCIFLKVNRIIGFQAKCYEHHKEFPGNAPVELYRYVKNLAAKDRKDRVWISCQSRPSITMDFYPQRYYQASILYNREVEQHNASEEHIDIYGAENSKFYSSEDFHRIVAVQLSEVERNVKYNSLCVLWAKNIKREFQGKLGKGTVRFELLIF